MSMSLRSCALKAGAISILTPRASRQSAVPHLLEAALLPCFATGIPAAEATMADNGEMLNVLEPSPPVPTISRTFHSENA